MNNDDFNKNEEENKKLEVNNTSNNNEDESERAKIVSLIDKINNLSSPEEFEEFMNGLSDDEKQLLSIKNVASVKPKKKVWLLFKVIETVVSILLLIALTGLLRPFNLKMPYGDLYYMGSVALSVFIFGFGLHFIRKPFVMIFYELIIDALVLTCMFLFANFLPFISYISELDEALYIFTFLCTKSILMTFIKKYAEKFL